MAAGPAKPGWRAALTWLPGLLLCILVGCGGEAQVSQEYPVALSEGTFRIVFGNGYPVADEAGLLAVTARLDRTSKQLVFTMADGSQQVLAFSPRPRSQWLPDCFTMSSHYIDEVADLTPAPLRMESLTFFTPTVFAKCSSTRMILADDTKNPSVFLALDLR